MILNAPPEDVTTEELQALIKQFVGGSRGFHKMPPLEVTDGVKAVIERTGAYWLLDEIDRIQSDMLEAHNQGHFPAIPEYQFWKLKVIEVSDGDNFAEFSMQEDEGAPFFYQIRIDPPTYFPIGKICFPVGTWRFWCIGGTLMLPEEY